MQEVIKNKLLENVDEKYKIFHSKIVNTKQNLLGVRLPILRSIAKDIAKSNGDRFIALDKCNIYEMVMLEGLVIAYLKKPFNKKIYLLDGFFKKVDSWAPIDSVILCIKNIDTLNKQNFNVALKWLKAKDEFSIRAGFVFLLANYIKKEYLQTIFKLCQKYNDVNKYYVYMANAWLISFCMAKFPNETIEFFKNNNLDKITHNKAISKSRESFRVSKENKELINKLKK